MPRTFHGFEVQEKIGQGGMSTVYRGVHTTLGYPVAIKVLQAALAYDADFISRFEREARAAANIKSQNIATVIDYGSEDETYFIVMEYLDGRDLRNLLGELQTADADAAPFPTEVTLLVLEEIARGLREAHHHGVIHRDIKPSNVMLCNRGEVKVVDFGLARDTKSLRFQSSSDLTRPGMVLGTPAYMSPEQAAGREDLDRRTDIFSLGVVAYELLGGVRPFRGDSITEVQESVMNDTPQALSRDRCPLVTPEISNFVQTCLAKNPDGRFQEMEAVLRALSECQESVDVDGKVFRDRYDLLSGFANDPRRCRDQLIQHHISQHLKRGFHFKGLGAESLADAIAQFEMVLALEPSHEKARAALRELESATVVDRTLPIDARDTRVGSVPPTLVLRPLDVESVPIDRASPGDEIVRSAEQAWESREEREPTAGSPKWLRISGICLFLVVCVLVAVEVTRRPPEKETPVGSLLVTSRPGGASVSIRLPDGIGFRATGRATPCVLDGLPLDEHGLEVEATLSGFHTDTLWALPVAGRTSQVGFDLESSTNEVEPKDSTRVVASYAELQFALNVDAKVTVDGRYEKTGRVLSYRLSPRQHWFVIEAPGFQRIRGQVDLPPEGKTLNHDLQAVTTEASWFEGGYEATPLVGPFEGSWLGTIVGAEVSLQVQVDLGKAGPSSPLSGTMNFPDLMPYAWPLQNLHTAGNAITWQITTFDGTTSSYRGVHDGGQVIEGEVHENGEYFGLRLVRF